MKHQKHLVRGFALGFLTLVLSSTASIADPKVCMLNFERRIHPFTDTLHELVKGHENDVTLIDEAAPTDLLDCVEKDYEEIIIVAHILHMDEEGDRVNLGYFKPMKEPDRSAYLAKARVSIREARDDYKLKAEQCYKRVGSKPINQIPCNGLQSKYKQMRTQLEFVRSMGQDYPVYGMPRPFLSIIFKRIQDVLAEKSKNGPIALKQIRFLNCDPDKILKRYPEFNSILKDYNIRLDISPAQQLMSLINGTRVSTLDPNWIEESLQSETAGKWAFAYVPLTTVGVYRWGERVIMKGKYKVSISGMALGLSEKWSLVYFPKEKLEGLSVGEEREFLMPHLDFSAAFWMNFEVGISPKPKFQAPTEINSIGAEVGVFSNITVKRLY